MYSSIGGKLGYWYFFLRFCISARVIIHINSTRASFLLTVVQTEPSGSWWWDIHMGSWHVTCKACFGVDISGHSPESSEPCIFFLSLPFSPHYLRHHNFIASVCACSKLQVEVASIVHHALFKSAFLLLCVLLSLAGPPFHTWHKLSVSTGGTPSSRARHLSRVVICLKAQTEQTSVFLDVVVLAAMLGSVLIAQGQQVSFCAFH